MFKQQVCVSRRVASNSLKITSRMVAVLRRSSLPLNVAWKRRRKPSCVMVFATKPGWRATTGISALKRSCKERKNWD